MTFEKLPTLSGRKARPDSFDRPGLFRGRRTVLRLAFLLFFFVGLIGFLTAATTESDLAVLSDSPASMQLEVRFRSGKDIFSPQETVSLDVRSIGGEAETAIAEDRPISLHVAVYPSLRQEQAIESSGGIPNFVPGISGKKHQESEKKGSVHEQEFTISGIANNPPIPVTFLAPSKEGVYKIVLSLQQKKDSPSQSLWSLSSISPNQLQRASVKVLAETSCQCVVVHPAHYERPVGDLSAFVEKELLEILDTTAIRSKRWASIPALPKVANLSTPKFPELPKLYQFRDRPVTAQPDVKNTETNFGEGNKELPEKNDSATHFERLPSCVLDFLEQFNTRTTGPYGSGHYKQRTVETKENQASDSNYSVLEPAPEHGDSWEAFPLTIREPDRTHLLEIEYPTDQTQSLGILVLDLMQDEKGKTIPVVSFNSGFYFPEDIIPVAQSKTDAIHRIWFRPKSKRSILLLSNRSQNQEAFFGKLSLYRVSETKTNNASSGFLEGITRLPRDFDETATRTVAGYVHTMNFLTEPCSASGSSFFARDFFGANAYPSDWQAAYEATSGLIEQLRRNGSDGVMFNVASKHGVLYPSLTLHYASENRMANTPDSPSAKDSLELMLRLFDREKLSAVPTIDFNMLLPVLENRLYQQPELSGEYLHVDLNGQAIEAAKSNGIKFATNGEHYNLLHPDVQEAMIDVLGELVGRCSAHSSFAGLGIILSPEGYAQLSNPLHGLDDRTIRQFQTETGIELSDDATAIKENSSSHRFAARIHYFRTHPEASEAWIAWRCQKVSEFYRRVHEVVVSARPEARLFLVGGTMLDHPDIRSLCQPSLFAGSQLPNTLRMIGFDFSKWTGMNSLVFLKPERFSSASNSENVQCYRDFVSPEWERYCEQFGLRTASLFFHDAENHFLLVPGGEQIRRRYVKQLVRGDVTLLFDGGNSLPAFENDSLLDFLAAFRRLPDDVFQTYAPMDKKSAEKTTHGDTPSLQPITIRYLKSSEGLFVYLINDAPFENKVTVRFRAAAGATLSELGGRRKFTQPIQDGSTLRWQVEMKAYDFIAVKLDGGTALIEDVKVDKPIAICGPAGLLKQKVDLLGEKIRKAQRGVLWDKLQNADCELAATNSDSLVGWENLGGAGFQVQWDSVVKSSGRSSLKLSKDLSADVGVLYSNSFDAPSTGRLFVSVSVGLPSGGPLPPLDIVLAGKLQGNNLMRSFKTTSVLKNDERQSSLSKGIYWQTIVVPFDRLPTQNLEDLRLGFVLTGPATLWIDDIKLYQIAFTKDEMNVLYRLVSVADRRCSNDRISDLLTILDGYWSQFLFRNVPMESPERPIAASTPNQERLRSETPRPQSETPLPKTAKKATTEKPKNDNNGFLDRFKKWLNP